MRSTPEDLPDLPEDGPALVTGAAGFVGSHLTEALAGLGTQVRAVDQAPSKDTFGSGVAYHRADVRDRERIARLLDGADVVFHLASVHLDVHAEAAEFRSVNVEATRQLVELCGEAGVRRLVHCSSVGVYGHVADPPAAEDAPKRPQNAYERTKLEGERAARARARELGVDLVVLRPAWVYGPRCPRTAKLLRAVRRGRFFYVGDGSNLRHPVYVEDMIRALLLAGAGAREQAGPYIIGGPRYLPLREVVETFAEVQGVPAPRLRVPRAAALALGWTLELAFGAVGREPPFSRRSLAFFENDNAFDTSKAERELGFRPSVALKEGLRRTLIWRAEG